MKVLYSLMQFTCRKVSQKFLKSAERLCCIIKMLRFFNNIVGACALYKDIHTIISAVIGFIEALTIKGLYNSKRFSKRISTLFDNFLPQMFSNSLYIFHYFLRFFENVAVYFLKYKSYGTRQSFKGFIYMTVTVWLNVFPYIEI